MHFNFVFGLYQKKKNVHKIKFAANGYVEYKRRFRFLEELNIRILYSSRIAIAIFFISFMCPFEAQ